MPKMYVMYGLEINPFRCDQITMWNTPRPNLVPTKYWLRSTHTIHFKRTRLFHSPALIPHVPYIAHPFSHPPFQLALVRLAQVLSIYPSPRTSAPECIRYTEIRNTEGQQTTTAEKPAEQLTPHNLTLFGWLLIRERESTPLSLTVRIHLKAFDIIIITDTHARTRAEKPIRRACTHADDVHTSTVTMLRNAWNARSAFTFRTQTRGAGRQTSQILTTHFIKKPRHSLSGHMSHVQSSSICFWCCSLRLCA